MSRVNPACTIMISHLNTYSVGTPFIRDDVLLSLMKVSSLEDGTEVDNSDIQVTLQGQCHCLNAKEELTYPGVATFKFPCWESTRHNSLVFLVTIINRGFDVCIINKAVWPAQRPHQLGSSRVTTLEAWRGHVWQKKCTNYPLNSSTAVSIRDLCMVTT